MTPNIDLTNYLERLDPSYRDLILGDFPRMFAGVFAVNHNLNSDNFVVFENHLTLFLLMATNQFQLTEAVVRYCGLSISESYSGISTLLENLPVGLIEEIQLTYTQIHKGNTQHEEYTLLNSLSESERIEWMTIKNDMYRELSQRLFLDPYVIEEITDLAGQALLGIITKNDFYRDLQTRIPSQSEVIISQIDPLFRIIKSTRNQSKEYPEATLMSELHKTSQAQLLRETTFNQPQSTNEITEIEQPISVNKPTMTTVHTMAKDMEVARQQQSTPTYTSSQSDILNRTNSNPPTPPPAPASNRPRWESDAR